MDSGLGDRNQDLLYRALSGSLSESGFGDDQTEIVTLLLMEQYDTEAAESIRVLPWVEDGLIYSEQYAVIDLQLMAAESREVFWALIGKPWMQDMTQLVYYVVRDFGYIATGPERDSRSALQIAGMPFLESVESTDFAATRILSRHHLQHPGSLPQFLSDLRLSTGITDASTGVVILTGLEQDNPQAGAAMWAMPWVADGIVESEVPLISRLAVLAVKDPSLALTAAEFVNADGEDLDSNLIDSLSVLAYAYPTLRDALVSQPWFADGLSREEAALVIVLAGIAGNSVPFFNDLLQTHYTQSRTISLPIAGEVNIWVIQDAPPPPDEDLLTIIEDTVRIAEGFLRVPFPTTDIILLAVPDGRGVFSGHGGSHMVLTRLVGEVRSIPHETAHYYFYFNFGQFWLREGGAQFFEAYVNDLMGVQDLADRKSELSRSCTNYENIRHHNYIRVHIYRETPGGDGPGPCDYVMGENLLINVFETIGGEAMSSALREIYVPYNEEPFLTGEAGRPPTDAEVYLAFLKHVPSDREEELRDLYRRLHGGAFVFSVTEFSDDHGDEATDATTVAVGQVVDGMLDYMFDFDYFQFNAEEGQLYQMGVDHESLRYTSITVYDPDGQTQEFQKWKARRRTPSGPEILWVAPGSGEYYFAVQNFGGENGPYTLVITAVEDAADDHGDNLATATGISLDETVEGTVDSDFDFDYFRFEAVEGRAYLIDVTGETLETIHVRLYTSDGAAPENWYENQYRDDSSWGDRASIEWTPLSSGEYYLAIDGAFGNVGTYTLTITEIDKDPGN